MYFYLQQKIDSAQQILDLMPFVTKLIDINTLKQQLKLLLTQQYESIKPKQSSNDTESTNIQESSMQIRSLFMSLFSLNGIPSDPIHAHILSFLPSNEYKKLPLLSTHFRNIFRNNPYLYNDKKYCVQLKFALKTSKSSKQSQTSVFVIHRSGQRSYNAIYFIPKSRNPYKNNLSANDISKLTIPLSHIKCWKISEEHTQQTSLLRINDEINDRSYNQDAIVFNDPHNRFILDLMSKHESKIQKLEIGLQTETIRDRIFAADQNQYESCIVLTFVCPIPEIKSNMFANLECLELFQSNNRSIDAITKIMQICGKTLKCFKYTGDIRFGSCSEKQYVLKIAAGVEWLSVVYPDGICIDLSECKRLLAVQIIGPDVKKHIIGPKKDENLIIFACIGDEQGNNEEYDVDDDGVDEEGKEFKNIKFVCSLKRRQGMRNFWRTGDLRDDWEYDQGDGQNKVNIDEYLMGIREKKMEKRKYLKLDKKSCNQRILGKILRFAMNNDKNKRKQVENRLKRWWYLNSANWIKNLCLMSKDKK